MWGSIWLILAKAIIQGWHSKQTDFVMAYTQSPIGWGMYMETPEGFVAEGDGNYVLQIHKNIYSQKQVVKSGTPGEQAQVHWLPPVQV